MTIGSGVRILLVMCCASQLAANGVMRVDLVVNEPYESRQVAWPITTGVPFPRGDLTNVRHCRLVDDLGGEQPLQTRVAATWDAARSSIRWLTIDFLAVPGRRYALEYGPDVNAAEPQTALRVFARDHTDGSTSSARARSGVRLSTGPLAAEFSVIGSAALKSVKLDLNGDGAMGPDEVVAAGAADGEHYHLDQNGQRASSASEGKSRQIVLEAAGPVRACVRVDGVYTKPDGRPIVRYRTRYHFFAGLGLMKVVDEFRVVGSTRNTMFRDIGFALQLPGGSPPRSIAIDADGQEGNQVATVNWRDSTHSVSSFQATYRHFGNQECRAGVVEVGESDERLIRRSDHVGEWLQVKNDRIAVTGSMRWMWQQFPKEWQATAEGLTLHLWSPRGGALDFSASGIYKFLGDAGREYLLEWYKQRSLNPVAKFFYYAGHEALKRDEVDGQGISKHHEFWFHFATIGEADVGEEYGRLVAKEPLALATPEWNCATDVFGPLMPRSANKSSGFETAKYEAIVDRIFDLGRYAQDAFGDYGWTVFGSGPHYSYQWDEKRERHYADPSRFEYHTYQKETQLWWCYLRSGERKFFDWAIPSEDHWVDVATTHVPLTYRSDWRGGGARRQTLHFRPGDWSIDSPLFHVRQRDSAEAWLRGGSQFWASYHRTLETTSLAYYLTGDERYNDVLEFWRRYWAGLAGKTSASMDIAPWFREQPWFAPTGPGERAKSWAKMIRDYAPFTSGLRHQMTQFFNLCTLYEHGWDPVIGQLVRECADVYLDPASRIGVWRTQENELPVFADAPKLAHFWVPALWKYERVTRDPRMQPIFRKYFDASLMADPFREDVGRYSNVHIAYAYYYTRDPRHLRPALNNLNEQLLVAAPLKDPRELGPRLYNPHTPIRALTGIPRLLWAMDTAKRDGVTVPPPAALKPQRAPIAFFKPAHQALHATLWGYDRKLTLFDPAGELLPELNVSTAEHASDRQPFDRTLPGCEVYSHRLTIPAERAAGFYVLAPRLEMAVLGIRCGERPGQALVNASVPVALSPGDRFHFRAPEGTASLQFESAAAAAVQVFGPSGKPLEKAVEGNRVMVELGDIGFDSSRARRGITFRSDLESGDGVRKNAWLRLIGLAAGDAWGSFQGAVEETPDQSLPESVLSSQRSINSERMYVAGRFGRALQIVPGRKLHIPDHVQVDGDEVKLFDLKQGTIEFYVKKLWDERLVRPDQVEYLTNGLVKAWCPRALPVGEWAHVAVEWRPLKRDPERQVVHVYVDGLDRQYYRSTWWAGYSQPLTFGKGGTWLREFICTTRTDAPYLIDELRISTVPRYADPEVAFGRQQTFNPARFDPPGTPFQVDEHTALLLHFDGDTTAESARAAERILRGVIREGE